MIDPATTPSRLPADGADHGCQGAFYPSGPWSRYLYDVGKNVLTEFGSLWRELWPLTPLLIDPVVRQSPLKFAGTWRGVGEHTPG